MPGLTRCRSSRRSGPAWACRPIAPRRRITPRSRRPADPGRIVVAPDSFKGSIGAAEAATALAEGWHRARPGDELVCLPLADGGEGTLGVRGRAPRPPGPGPRARRADGGQLLARTRGRRGVHRARPG